MQSQFQKTWGTCGGTSQSAICTFETWNPNDPCFEWKGPSLGGFNPQNRGQIGSGKTTTKSPNHSTSACTALRNCSLGITVRSVSQINRRRWVHKAGVIPAVILIYIYTPDNQQHVSKAKPTLTAMLAALKKLCSRGLPHLMAQKVAEKSQASCCLINISHLDLILGSLGLKKTSSVASLLLAWAMLARNPRCCKPWRFYKVLTGVFVRYE